MDAYNGHSKDDLRQSLEWEVGLLANGLDEARHKLARILIAATLVGPSIGAIVDLTGYSEPDVTNVAFLMWASRMWLDAEVDYSAWGSNEIGMINFLLDLSVAEGVLVRTQQIRDGKPVYMSAIHKSVN